MRKFYTKFVYLETTTCFSPPGGDFPEFDLIARGDGEIELFLM